MCVLHNRPISVALAPLHENPTRLQASCKTFCVRFVAGNSNTSFEVVGAVNVGGVAKYDSIGAFVCSAEVIMSTCVADGYTG
jgi:hypothetical protein